MSKEHHAARSSRKVNVRAAGGVIWRTRGSGVEVVLIHRPRYDDWSFPKGKLEGNEGLRACAVREIYEETHLAVALGRPVGTIRYRLGNGQLKEVTYWAAQELSTDHPAVRARPHYKPASTHEIDDLRWVSIPEAYEKLTEKLDRDILRRVENMHNEGALDTRPILVVRHARAVKRSNWKKGKGSENSRPLTTRGTKQSSTLALALSLYGVESVLSSPWKRCADTIAPYCEATGIPPELRDELTEAAYHDKKRGVTDTVRSLLRTPGSGTAALAICMHRPTLGTVFHEIRRMCADEVVRAIPDEDPYLRTGEILVLHTIPREGKKSKGIAVEVFRPTTR
ncbi:NUDIX hydrolase [Arcanobacterium haemolyticum]|nr:NUDIX hydrolase [Arcanobacterium haemolyticum]